MPRKPIYTPEERIRVRRARDKVYRQNNKDKRAQNTKAYQASHKEELRQYGKAYRQNNKETLAAKARLRLLKNLQKRSDYLKAYYEANKDHLRAQQKIYARKHPHIFKAKNSQRRAREKRASVNDFTAAQWRAMKAAYGNRCVYCNRKMQHLTQDHIIPLSKGGNNTYSNIVPACLRCNSKKHAGPVLCPIQPLLLL